MAADDYAYVPGGGGGAGGGGSNGGSSSLARKQQQHHHLLQQQQDNSLKDPSHRHPNQYTKKRTQGSAIGASSAFASAIGGSGAQGGVAGGSLYPPIPTHPLGMTAVDAVKEKRRGGEPLAPTMSQNGNSSRAGSVVGGAGGSTAGHVYGAAGMASQDEYNLATLGGQRAAAKRKQEDVTGSSKRRKKGYVCDSFSSCEFPAVACPRLVSSDSAWFSRID